MARAKQNLMTQKAYADLRGVSPQYINKLVTQGKIVKVGRLIEKKQADEAIKTFQRAGRVVMPTRRADKTKHRGTAKGASRGGVNTAREPKLPRGETITQWRLQTEKYKALNAELEHKKAVGLLLDRDQVLAAERIKNERIRSAVRALPRSLAPVISRCASAAETESLLREELDRVLLRLAEDLFGTKDDAASLAMTPAEENVPAAPVQTPALECEAHA